jgi:hypothetical protein
VRERIEAELDPRPAATSPAGPAVDAASVLADVEQFAELVRSGAYIGGTRRVSPKERTRWRFTFRRLVAEAQTVLQTDDAEDGERAEQAMEALVDLACEMHDYDYVRSEDPVEAAGLVVSDAVGLLWSTMCRRRGFAGFAQRATPQLVRWERPHGWTRQGWGRISEKETTLTMVLAPMLQAPDMWLGFADRYLDALDRAVAEDESPAVRGSQDLGYRRSRRADHLAEWNELLMERLARYASWDRIERLTNSPALAGPEHTFLRAQQANLRGEVELARGLIGEALEELPGHQEMLDFALEIGAPLPARAKEAQARHA